MNDRQKERLIFENYSFTELDRHEEQLGVVCDGAAWHGFMREIRERGGVLEAIGAQLRHAGQTHNFSNQFAVMECWYNVARLYSVECRLKHGEFCSPDAFVERLERMAFDG
jgi:hypothetical protein